MSDYRYLTTQDFIKKSIEEIFRRADTEGLTEEIKNNIVVLISDVKRSGYFDGWYDYQRRSTK